jgi:hypothetical protein
MNESQLFKPFSGRSSPNGIDLTNKQFDYLTVLYRGENYNGKEAQWVCQCRCGNIVLVRGYYLRSGHTKSCGCRKNDPDSEPNANKRTNLLNRRFGKLLVVKYLGSSMWECKCDCGKLAIVKGQSLLKGQTKSCGCLVAETARNIGKSTINNLVGRRFGKLVVIKEHNSRVHGSVMWECECDCGGSIITSRDNLVDGRTQSCGCLRYDDLRNQRFGLLTALRPCNDRPAKDGKIWECKCDCGNIVFVGGNKLKTYHTTSCGCITESIGEINIEKILKENDIPYMRDFPHFKDLRFQSGGLGRYDFILYPNTSNLKIIEFDGIQHFKPTGGWSNDIEDVRTRDIVKNNYAFSHNYPLIRIPYYERDNITINMILGDQYLIRNSEEYKSYINAVESKVMTNELS